MSVRKIFIYITLSIAVVIGLAAGFYVKGLPFIVSNPVVINYIQKTVKNSTGVNLIIDKPVLHTEFSPKIDFNINRLYVDKDGTKLIEVNKFSSTFSFAEILKKKFIIKKLIADSIFVDINSLESLMPASGESKKETEWNVDIFDAWFGVRTLDVVYSINPDTIVKLHGKHIGVNNAEKIKRNVYFQLKADISRKGNSVLVELNDNKKVYFENKKFHISETPLRINKSNIFINATADKKQNFEVNLYSKNFNLNDIIDFLNTQVIENNVNETLAYFADIDGFIDFNLNITNKDINGDFRLKRLDFKVIPVDNIPITLTKGEIKLTSHEVSLDKFEGYYDNDKKNELDFKGTVKDYLKTMDTDLVGNAKARGGFFRTHLSKMTGTALDLTGEAPTRVMLKSKNNIMDIVWLFMLKPGENIKVAGDYLPFEDTLRVMSAKMHLEDMLLDITSLDYYMAQKDELPTGKPRSTDKRPEPIFKFSSSIDIADNNSIKFVGFEIPKPLPSELLNVILKQDLFQKGKIGGKLIVNNTGKFPTLNGSLNIDRVFIPSQRIFIKEASLLADGNLIHLMASGGFRRARYKFDGDILNEIKFPVVVKDVNLSIDNMDLYRILSELSGESTENSNVITTDTGTINIDGTEDNFDIGNIIIENGKFHLANGTYKDIKFGNLDADLTLDKNSILNIKSNRFEIAEGVSSLKVNCDFKNEKYNFWLGTRDVNSDIMAKSLLNLTREISGKASGVIDLNLDKTLKLNGSIKFIVKDGTIEKIGLVEYIMKCAALFRNPVTMISPAIFSDIVNVPEGKFDKITGTLELKNNVARRIKIKTYSPQMSTYIAGRYNLDNKDTSMRIYTKFSGKHKGITGILRNISLNALATRIPLSSRNDENYYASELSELPDIDAPEKDCQIFLTKVEGDVENNNYISSLKKIK